jgi:homoserine kinase type II
MSGSDAPSQAPNGFEPYELAMALSHYDTGVIREIRQIRRGSSDAPKALLRTDRGRLLFKRRGPSRSRIDRVAFSHRLQLHLAARGYPLPRLLGTRDENNSILRLGERLYELFEYVAGESYSGSERETRAAGRALAILHRLTADFDSSGSPAALGYHASERARRRLRAARERLSGEGAETAARLSELYEESAKRVEALGYGGWPRQVVHGDWHPGNVVFREGEVSAALDYDAAHVDARCADVASGALQFSLHRGGADLSTWEAAPEEGRLRWFLGGYDAVEGCRLSDSEIDAAPWLMIESLIAEASGPVAETGRFGPHDGPAFLAMIERKARWLQCEHGRAGSWVEPSS